jgi:hypothetical protein
MEAVNRSELEQFAARHSPSRSGDRLRPSPTGDGPSDAVGRHDADLKPGRVRRVDQFAELDQVFAVVIAAFGESRVVPDLHQRPSALDVQQPAELEALVLLRRRAANAGGAADDEPDKAFARRDGGLHVAHESNLDLIGRLTVAQEVTRSLLRRLDHNAAVGRAHEVLLDFGDVGISAMGASAAARRSAHLLMTSRGNSPSTWTA